MRYTTFGRNNGLRVSEYALGAGNFGTRWGTGAEPAEARRIFERFAEAGGTFIDTAESYQFGESEEILADLIAADRDRFTLATKFANGVNPQAGVNGTGNGRKNMMRAVEKSLKRLKTDYIDLFWVHFPDPVTPTEEILRGFDDLIRAGKIHYAGLSNFPAWRVSRAAALAEVRGWSPISAVQFEYSLVERGAEREQLPMADALGLGAAMWSPLGGGLLTGKYRGGYVGRQGTALKHLIHTEEGGRKTAVLDTVLAVAAESGAAPAQVAMAWLRERAARAVTAYVPVIGPRTVEQLDDYLASLDVVLTPEQYERLTTAGAIPLGEPYAQIAGRQNAILGGDAERFRTPVVPVA